MIASAGWDKTIRLWDVQSGMPLHALTGHRSRVTAVAFSPDGKFIASGSRDNTARLWDVESAAAVHTLAGLTGRVSSVAFSPDRKHLASGSRDNTVRLWNVATAAAVRTPTGPKGGVTSVAFSPDGKTVASGSEDNSVWVWDVQNSTALHTLASLSWDALLGMLAQQYDRHAEAPSKLQTLNYSKASWDKSRTDSHGRRKSPETILSSRQPEGQVRVLRGSVIAGIPQT
jgi:WD40 repeat protein